MNMTAALKNGLGVSQRHAQALLDVRDSHRAHPLKVIL